MKLALSFHAVFVLGMRALHQANVDIHGPNTILAALGFPQALPVSRGIA